MSVGTGTETTSNGKYIEWVLDSGSSMHYTKHLWALTDLRDEFHVGQQMTGNWSQSKTKMSKLGQLGDMKPRFCK
jgi:hypothetical protein